MLNFTLLGVSCGPYAQKWQKYGPFLPKTWSQHGSSNDIFLNLNCCAQGCSMPNFTLPDVFSNPLPRNDQNMALLWPKHGPSNWFFLNPLFTRGGTFTLPTFKSPTVLRARFFLVQNHLVNSYLCIDGVLRPFLGHFDAIHGVQEPFSRADSKIFGGEKIVFFWFKGQKIILKPAISPKNQSKITATCVGYNLRHFSGQLVKF